MKQIRTVDAIGHTLCHDITRIIPGGEKGVAFKKGHVIREEDIPELIKIGKVNLFVWEDQADMVHENDAAEVLFSLVAGEGMAASPVKEGKVEIFAGADGVLRVDRDRLAKLNAFDEIMVAVRHDNVPVRKGDKLAGTRIIPLAIARETLNAAVGAISGGAVLSVKPFRKKRSGIVTTGSEVASGLIQDGFTPVVRAKLAEYGGADEVGHHIVSDEPDQATGAILSLIEAGAQIVLVTGGMSVDPDDKTPLAIRNTGAHIVSYGAPVLPGAMFMTAYLGEVPIVGLPGCVMHSRRTILDLILPRLMADIPVTRDDIDALAVGGLCLECPTCIFPNCGFGAL